MKKKNPDLSMKLDSIDMMNVLTFNFDNIIMKFIINYEFFNIKVTLFRILLYCHYLERYKLQTFDKKYCILLLIFYIVS